MTFCFGTALIALAYCYLTPSSYTADTTIELRGHAPILASIQSENLFGTDSRKIEYLKTTVAKLKLAGLADAALGRNGLGQDLTSYWRAKTNLKTTFTAALRRLAPTISIAESAPSIKGAGFFKHSPNEIKRYLSLIDIDPVHETNLVHIKATTTDRALSQKIANLHATEFIEHLKRERQGAIQANVDLLRAQSDALRERVAQAEDQLSAYASANKLLLVKNNDGAGLNHRHIESLAQMLADATGRRIKSESALNQARKQRDDEGTFFDGEITQQLRANLKQSETEYASLGSQVTAAYPTMRELQAKISALRKAIRDERKQGLQSLEAQFSADSGAENSLREQIETEKAKAQEVAKKLIQYDVLSREASSLRELYQAVLKQAKEIEMSASVTTSNVFVADYATLPTSPSAPKTNIIVILAAIIGLSAGILMSYILESLDDTIVTAQELRQMANLPLLGSVPDFDSQDKSPPKVPARIEHSPESNEQESGETSPERLLLSESASAESSALVTISAPHTAISEALRSIRANVLLSSADYPPRVIMIASSIQGEGKTTLLSNLAVTLAQANHKTLMIDADLRMCGLSNLFLGQQEEHRGLSDLLTSRLPLESVIYPTGVAGLDLLPVGTTAPNPAELVGSESMKRLLSGLKDRYDFILVDTPPIMAVADALLISRAVDSVILVARGGFTPRHTVREAREKLTRVRARIIGTVLNGATKGDSASDIMAYGSNYPRKG
jgi:capsular exopolysaccharide synthesis family protein